MRKILIIVMMLIGGLGYSQEKSSEKNLEKNQMAIIITSENKVTVDNVDYKYIVAEAYKATHKEQIEDMDKYVFTVYNPISLFSEDTILAYTELKE